jgi:hypothetical protein
MDKVTVKHIDEMHSGEHAGPQKILDVGHDLGVEGLGMRILKLAPNDPDFPAPGDGHEEVYVVLEGDAVLHTPEGTTNLDPSVVVRVGDAVARRIVPGDVGATILAIGRV